MQILPSRNSMPIRTLRPSKSVQWGTLLPALAAGLAAAGLAFLLVRGRLPAQADAPQAVMLVVAARDIPARTLLSAGALRLRAVPVGDVPEGAAKSPSVFLGKVSVQPIPAGTALTESAVSVPSAALGMAFALPPTLRAVTVATDPADGVELFVRPEDHVDILATDEPGAGPAEARTVLQDVLLLAVGSQTSPDPPTDPPSGAAAGAAHVTVAVSPVQAQALVLAAARGHLHLALRAIGDGTEAPLPALPAPVVAAPRKPRRQAERVTPLKIEPLPPLPSVPPAPRLPAVPPRPVMITVVKGTLSQTVSVAP
jgi:pilus assembly protein CpaB